MRIALLAGALAVCATMGAQARDLSAEFNGFMGITGDKYTNFIEDKTTDTLAANVNLTATNELKMDESYGFGLKVLYDFTDVFSVSAEGAYLKRKSTNGLYESGFESTEDMERQNRAEQDIILLALNAELGYNLVPSWRVQLGVGAGYTFDTADMTGIEYTGVVDSGGEVHPIGKFENKYIERVAWQFDLGMQIDLRNSGVPASLSFGYRFLSIPKRDTDIFTDGQSSVESAVNTSTGADSLANPNSTAKPRGLEVGDGMLRIGIILRQ